jgi:hypothetical protein
LETPADPKPLVLQDTSSDDENDDGLRTTIQIQGGFQGGNGIIIRNGAILVVPQQQVQPQLQPQLQQKLQQLLQQQQQDFQQQLHAPGDGPGAQPQGVQPPQDVPNAPK